jgi:transcription initiation factor TFIIIB Brf1 subunit/transcription initiation factor TFIIB
MDPGDFKKIRYLKSILFIEKIEFILICTSLYLIYFLILIMSQNTECLHSYIWFDNQYVCQFCGLVEYYTQFTDQVQINEKTPRHHEVKLYPIGNRTIIDTKDILKLQNQRKLWKLSHYNWFLTDKERRFKKPYDLLYFYGNLTTIPNDVKITAWKIMKTCILDGVTKGRTIEGCLIASIFTASRICNRSINVPNEIALISNKTIIHNQFVIIQKILPKLKMKYPVEDVAPLLQQILTKLNLTQYYIEALKISKFMEKFIHSKLRVLIGGVIYWISRKYRIKLNQKSISDACNITDVSLRRGFNILLNHTRN